MSDARLLSGSVVDEQADGLTPEVPSVPAGTTGAQEGLFQQILITRKDLLELESKRLDNTRTRLAVATGVVWRRCALAVTMLRGHSSGESAVNEPPGTFNLAIPRMRLGGFVFLVGVGRAGIARTPPATHGK